MAERRKDLYRTKTPKRRLKDTQYINPVALWNRLKEMGRNPSWLAEQMGVSPSTIHNYLVGTRRVPHKRADQLTNLLRLPAAQLLSPKPPPRVPEGTRGERRSLPYANVERVRDEMERRGWTVADLARAIGITHKSTRRLLAETMRLKPETQVALSQALDLPREDVIDLEPVDPALGAGRVMEEPKPYEIRETIAKGVRTVIRPRRDVTVEELLEQPAEAGLPCGCVVYWTGDNLTDDTLDEVREHYRSHVEGLMQEPGLLEDQPNPRTTAALPVAHRRTGRVLWPRLPGVSGPKIRRTRRGSP